MSEAMMLWDGLFATSSPISDIVQWTCVAMLIRIRTKRKCRNMVQFLIADSDDTPVISSDYSTQLMHLLRYPTCPVHEEGALYHILLLIRQATALEMLHTPSAGASLAIENRNLLNISLEISEPPPVVRRKARPIERTHQTTFSEHISRSPSTEGLRQQPSFQLGFPELIARGLLDRGENLSINKTVMNAMSELKVRLHDTFEAYVLKPHTAQSS